MSMMMTMMNDTPNSGLHDPIELKQANRTVKVVPLPIKIILVFLYTKKVSRSNSNGAKYRAAVRTVLFVVRWTHYVGYLVLVIYRFSQA